MCFILYVVHYFSCRLKVTIEREIALNEQGILFYLMVTKDSTIEQLQLMVCTCSYGANGTVDNAVNLLIISCDHGSDTRHGVIINLVLLR